MTMTMTMGKGRGRSRIRNLSGAGARAGVGNFKNGRLWQPCSIEEIKEDFFLFQILLRFFFGPCPIR